MKPNSVTIKITTTGQVKEHLEAILPTGLYGRTVSEAAERVLCLWLEGNLKRTTRALIEANVSTGKEEL